VNNLWVSGVHGCQIKFKDSNMDETMPLFKRHYKYENLNEKNLQSTKVIPQTSFKKFKYEEFMISIRIFLET